MRAAFLLYTTTKEDRLDSYYTLDNFNSVPFIASSPDNEEDIITKLLFDLSLEIDSKRVQYLGTINFNGMAESSLEVDCVSIDVSSINMEDIVEKYRLKLNPAFMMGREENSIILSLFMKLILTKKKLADIKEEKPKD